MSELDGVGGYELHTEIRAIIKDVGIACSRCPTECRREVRPIVDDRFVMFYRQVELIAWRYMYIGTDGASVPGVDPAETRCGLDVLRVTLQEGAIDVHQHHGALQALCTLVAKMNDRIEALETEVENGNETIA